MSLTGSLLGLVLIPLKARPREQPREVDNLAVMALADEVRRLQFALDHWRNAYGKLETEYERMLERRVTLMDENARLRAENGVLRHREQAQAHGQQMAAQNYQGQNAALHNQQFAQYHGLLGQQGMQQQSSFAGHCTCVPARADALRNDNSQ